MKIQRRGPAMPRLAALGSLSHGVSTEVLHRLCELSVKDQWRIGQLDWSGMDLSMYPSALRQAAADALVQIQLGEATAALVATRLRTRADPGAVQDLLAAQVMDEQRHVQFFSDLIFRLDCQGQPRDTVQALMAEVATAESTEQMLVGMHILIEGVAHSFFMGAAAIFEQVDDSGTLLAPIRQVIVDWLPNLLARDENRHIALGVQLLRQQVPMLSPTARDRLESQVERWGGIVHEMAADPDVIEGTGLDGLGLSTQCVQDMNLRLAQVGLETRVPEVRVG
jgi:hypothetical protein